MTPRITPRVVVLLVLATLSGLPGSAEAFREQAPQAASNDEKAIRALDETFVVEYNKGDSKALAALFAEDAEVVEADGRRFQGRELIEKDYAETFETQKGIKIVFEIEAIRFLSKDVAKEEGRSIVMPLKGAPVSRLYTVLYVKKDGRWLFSDVKEELDPLVPPHERLKELDWLIGDWVDEGSDSEVRLQCKRSVDANFLIRSFTVIKAGKMVMTVTQRIGWDPVSKQFRSWEFDSEGGFGEGRWSRSGDTWVVKHTGVRPEGTTASATNTMTLVRPGHIRWTSTERVIGEESIAGEDSHVLVRVPPLPRTVPNIPTSTTTLDTQRTPR